MPKLIKQYFISIRSAMTIIGWLYFSMVSVVLAVLFYFLASLDNQHQDDLRQRVSLALENETVHSIKVHEEYSFWDEAYQKVYLKKDQQWTENTFGPYVVDSYGIDFVLILGENGKVVYLNQSDQLAPINVEQLLAENLTVLTAQSEQLETVTQITTATLKFNNKLFQVTAGPFIDEEEEIAREDTFLIFAHMLDDDYLSKISKSYQITELALTDATATSANSKVIVGLDGSSIGALSWHYDAPSEDILPAVSAVLLAFLILTITICKLILNRELSNREEYEQKIYFEATRDPLTGVNNRRYFTEVARNELAATKRSTRPLSVLMLDIDFFKQVNDTYGHRIGDLGLIHVTQICSSTLRTHDIFGRLGGEEFAVILPNTDRVQAQEVAERIREQIMLTPLECNGKTINLTVSIGLTELDQQDSYDAMIDHADKAMYKAKSSGRNCVQCYAK